MPAASRASCRSRAGRRGCRRARLPAAANTRPAHRPVEPPGYVPAGVHAAEAARPPFVFAEPELCATPCGAPSPVTGGGGILPAMRAEQAGDAAGRPVWHDRARRPKARERADRRVQAPLPVAYRDERHVGPALVSDARIRADGQESEHGGMPPDPAAGGPLLGGVLLALWRACDFSSRLAVVKAAYRSAHGRRKPGRHPVAFSACGGGGAVWHFFRPL